MAKMAKKTQTDYTRGGKAISDTAIPYYQNTLTTINDYVQNPYNTVDTILDKYYSNDVNQSDFLRNYNRAMGNAAANNYAAMGGGYSSAGQRAYNDTQRYQNDLAARLRSQGVQNAANIQNTWMNQALSAADRLSTAYGHGKDYSDIEQFNYIADQYNGAQNQIGGVASGAGKVLSAIPTPWTQALGAGLQMAGGAMQIDPSSALSSIGASAPSSGSGGWAESIATGLAGTDWSKMGTVFANAKMKANSGINKVGDFLKGKVNSIKTSGGTGQDMVWNA